MHKMATPMHQNGERTWSTTSTSSPAGVTPFCHAQHWCSAIQAQDCGAVSSSLHHRCEWCDTEPKQGILLIKGRWVGGRCPGASSQSA